MPPPPVKEPLQPSHCQELHLTYVRIPLLTTNSYLNQSFAFTLSDLSHAVHLYSAMPGQPACIIIPAFGRRFDGADRAAAFDRLYGQKRSLYRQSVGWAFNLTFSKVFLSRFVSGLIFWNI